ncbi:MAG: asparagine synthase (glutamine-hydrolyzing) [Pseudonocardiaceae bacterium]
MCGITGWVSFDRDLVAERGTIDTMTRTMACRGPDAEGVWIDRHVGLGHRRLSVIDLDGGRQPMAVDTPEGSVAMVYSGEAYNFTELRDELRRRGHQFRTVSDTEVVLRGYLEWGQGVADRLGGMYAFAIWDTRSDTLVMIRDRMGIKPFYYFETTDGVLFGSEPKAILANPLARHVIDADGLRELLSFSKTPGHAVWSGMREVQPGTVVTVGRHGLRSNVYWKLETTQHTDDTETTVVRVRELLDDIVGRQLVADVPRCVLLSGGLDSSTITALAAQQLDPVGEKVRTFAVDFAGLTENFVPDELRATPDGPYVQDVHKYVGTQHEDIVLDPRTLSDPLVRTATITARDLPNGFADLDSSLYLLFKAIREHSTVALSGESADEVFGGYKWFHDPVVQQADMFPWVAGARIMGGDTPALLDADLLAILDLPGYLRDSYRSAVAEVIPLDGESEHERRMRVMSYLHLTRFVRALLDRKDRMSMAVGLEVRVPFCDHRLVEYVYNAPWSMKTFDGREKSLLRAAAADVLPQSVVERVKSPYPSTQDPDYAAVLQQQVKELLAERDHPVFELFNRDWLTNTNRLDPASMTLVTRNSLERVLNFGIWLDHYRPRLTLD